MPNYQQQPPKSWEECLKIADDSSLFTLLRGRLAWLAFNTDSAVSTRAIEMLFTQGQNAKSGDLGDLSTEQLERIHNKAVELIHSEVAREGRENGF